MSKNLTSVNLCTCNNCGNILIDENPQTNAKEYKIDIDKVKSLAFIKDEKDEESGEEYYFWACPFCKTDDCLDDKVDEEEIKKLK